MPELLYCRSEIRDVEFHVGGDGLTVEARIAPFGLVIEHNDNIPGRPMYRERFVPGISSSMAAAPHRVKLAIDHESGYAATVGRGDSVREAHDGAYATFRLYRAEAERAKDFMDTTHKGMSLEFLADPRRMVRRDGVFERGAEVRIVRVAAVPDPAYATARVLSIRGAAEGEGDPLVHPGELEPLEPVQTGGTPHLDQVRAFLASQRGAYTLPSGGGGQ